MFTGTLAAVSNREDWKFTVELTDPATNDFVDLTDSTINIAVRPQRDTTSSLSGSNSDGHITVTGDGTFDVAFSPDEMKTLLAGFYDTGITVLLSTGITYQLLAGVLPVVDGVMDI